MLRQLICSIFLLLLLHNAIAQYITNANATTINCHCYQLTDAANNQAGSVWNSNKINLTQPFNYSFDVYYGCADANGADGISFILQPVSTSIGSTGGGLGFSGITPSVGVLMDTYQNTSEGDPTYDHISINKDGDVNHATANRLAGPVGFDAQNSNVEDCQFHDFGVTWNATTKTLKIFYECKERLSYTGDIVNTIFGGDPYVYWGFTAATGGLSNVQEVCLRYTSFLDKSVSDTIICKGGRVQLKAQGGVSYKWLPTTSLSNPNIAEPFASPDSTTLYRVEVADKCNRVRVDTVKVNVGGDPLSVELGPDVQLCKGQTLRLSAKSPLTQGAFFKWQDGSKDSVFTVQKAGTYSVKLERNGCFYTDSVQVAYLSPPSVSSRFPSDTTLCHGKKLILKAQTPDASYRWRDGSTQAEYPVATAGIYDVVVVNRCGVDSARTNVKYEDCERVYIPTVFSPNNDRINDRFFIQDGGNVLEIKSLKIFDRWGGLVFQAFKALPNDELAGWDGYFNNTLSLPDVYVYVAEILFKNGETTVRKGDVTLIR